MKCAVCGSSICVDTDYLENIGDTTGYNCPVCGEELLITLNSEYEYDIEML